MMRVVQVPMDQWADPPVESTTKRADERQILSKEEMTSLENTEGCSLEQDGGLNVFGQSEPRPLGSDHCAIMSYGRFLMVAALKIDSFVNSGILPLTWRMVENHIGLHASHNGLKIVTLGTKGSGP